MALLRLSTVAAVLTTDSATMGIQVDALCQRHTPIGLKFTGNSSLVLPLGSFRPCEHPRQERCSHFPSFVSDLVSVISCPAVWSRPGEFTLLQTWSDRQPFPAGLIS